MTDALRHLPRGAIVDLGCGRGDVAAELVERGDTVVGIDISPVQIERARAKVPGATFVVADMTAWDAEPASVDGVLALWSAIELPVEDQSLLWKRAATWLRPGGVLVAIVDDERPLVEVTLGWLAEAGLRVTHTEAVPDAHTLVVAGKG